MFLEDMNRWLLLLDDVDDPTQYPMNWKAAFGYVDVEADGKFRVTLLFQSLLFERNR